MSMMLRRHSNPVAEMLSWLERTRTTPPDLGLVSQVRVEDSLQDGRYVLRAEIPGVDPETDLDVRVADDQLIIEGSRQEEERSTDRHELRYGTFYRVVSLPAGADSEAATATYRDGVLEVTIPITGDAAATRQVPVARAGG